MRRCRNRPATDKRPQVDFSTLGIISRRQDWPGRFHSPTETSRRQLLNTMEGRSPIRYFYPIGPEQGSAAPQRRRTTSLSSHIDAVQSKPRNSTGGDWRQSMKSSTPQPHIQNTGLCSIAKSSCKEPRNVH